MATDRLVRILALFARNGDADGRRVCKVAAEVTAMTGAGVMILAKERPQASVCTTDAVSALIEELQYTLGEGPCVDAHRSGMAVAEPDLEADGFARWKAFSSLAVEAGARAVFGFPVRIGAVRLGALNLYRDHPGALTDDQHADALVMADVAARAVLDAQAGAPHGELGPDLEAGVDQWLIVHQAAGMISAQLDISVEDALVSLRARAFSVGRLITEIAQDVVDRRLRFDADE